MSIFFNFEESLITLINNISELIIVFFFIHAKFLQVFR